MHDHLRGPQGPTGAHKGPAHKGLAYKGPGGSQRPRAPTRAHGGPQGPAPHGPRGPTRAQGAHMGLAHKGSGGPEGPQGPTGAHKGPAHMGGGIARTLPEENDTGGIVPPLRESPAQPPVDVHTLLG